MQDTTLRDNHWNRGARDNHWRGFRDNHWNDHLSD